jgi:hypothetical protein
MEVILILAALVLLAVLAARFGYDSREFNPRDSRGWWPR